MIHNALYWLEEFAFDGLRLDAVHAIRDDSDPDILTELAQTVPTASPTAKYISSSKMTATRPDIWHVMPNGPCPSPRGGTMTCTMPCMC